MGIVFQWWKQFHMFCICFFLLTLLALSHIYVTTRTAFPLWLIMTFNRVVTHMQSITWWLRFMKRMGPKAWAQAETFALRAFPFSECTCGCRATMRRCCVTCLCSLHGDTDRENDGCLERVQDISRPSSSISSKHTNTWWRRTGWARMENKQINRFAIQSIIKYYRKG